MATIQITVRLPADQVRFIDEEVAAGHAKSRAAAIARALRRDRTLRDLEIIEAAGPDPDLEALVEWAATNQAFPADG